jgi:hypothetical protein
MLSLALMKNPNDRVDSQTSASGSVLTGTVCSVALRVAIQKCSRLCWFDFAVDGETMMLDRLIRNETLFVLGNENSDVIELLCSFSTFCYCIVVYYSSRSF